jgi:Cu+-exporting ATPase
MTMTHSIVKSILYGTLASTLLLGVYFAVLSLVSGFEFAQSQFTSFWYFIVSLAVGFGIQIGLYAYLKDLIQGGADSVKVLGVTGMTSTAAMISCCAHYLVNLVPILGVTGLATLVAQYQIKLFFTGIVFNIIGIGYMVYVIIKAKKQL